MKYFPIILICLFNLLTTSFASQYGSISGYFLDEHFEALPGGDIAIEGTNQTTKSDDNGYYKIMGVSSGTYTLKFMFVGYAPVSVHNVKVVPDSDTEILICVASAEFSDPPKFYHDYDASDAKITPFNPSQKTLDLENTGKVDLKEKSKYPKLLFARKFKILQNEKERKFPFIDLDQFVGYYKIGTDRLVNVIEKDSNLYILNFEYFRTDSRDYHKIKLYHEGNRKFIFTETTGNVTFTGSNIFLNFFDDFEMISEGDVGSKISDISNIPVVLMQQGNIYKAVELYKEIYRSDPNDQVISEKRLKHLFLSIESDQVVNEMKIAFVKMCLEFYPESNFFYFQLGDLNEKSEDLRSALQYYIKAQKYGYVDKIGLENRIKELERKLK